MALSPVNATPNSTAAHVIAEFREALEALGSPESEAEAIDCIAAAERLKSTAAALQARHTAVLEQFRYNAEAERGVAKARWGKGLAGEIGLARGDSPARGGKHLNVAGALLTDLPHTYAALQSGDIHEEHAQVVVHETSWLSAAHRQQVDAGLADQFTGLGPRQLGGKVRGHAQKLDQQAAVKRQTKARSQRHVSVRPAPEGMAYVTALLPLQQAVGVYASLHEGARELMRVGEIADPMCPKGSPRTKNQIMADLFAQRATGQATAPAVPATVHVVMTDAALFGDDETPAWVTGHGPIPATIAKQWLADPDTTAFMRRVFTRPTDNKLVSLDSQSRTFPKGLRRMVLLRDGVCNTPYCDAPIREIDHIRPVREGGPTTWNNASGLCSACNQRKENTGWQHQSTPDGLSVKTPTGHDYTAKTPPLIPGQSPHTGPPKTGRPPDDEEPPDLKTETSNFCLPDTIQCTMRVAA